jgi:cysteine synthase A
MRIRRAEPNESAALARLWYDGWRDAHLAILPEGLARVRTLESFQERMEANLNEVRVVGEPGAPLGFYMLKGDELDQLYVSAEARGAGVAAALIADAEQRLRESGVETAWLGCAIGNERAARFYEKRGWKRVGVYLSHLETVEGIFDLDVWRYEKPLTPTTSAKDRGMSISRDVLATIGNTPLVELRRVLPPNCARVFVKVEGQNPTGSMKDRMAQAMIGRAEGDGRLNAGDTVVEYTGGSTGASLALVCAAKGYRLRIVTSTAFSEEKLTQMEALGAELTLVPSDGGLINKNLILRMIEAAREISREPRTYWTDQLNNVDSIAGYAAMGEEIWSQSQGKVDAFIQAVGTTASLRGVSSVLRRYDAKVKIVAVEPAESAVLSGRQPGAHKIEGIGIGYAPPMWDASIVDEIVPISTADAEAMARRLAREEGLFAGTSSGANVLAAIQVGERLGPSARVVTLLVDSGLKYLSTDVYRRR